MKRSRFKADETTLCTYVARFGRVFIDEREMHRLFRFRRPQRSYVAKVRRIAAMLVYNGYAISPAITSTLSGTTTGQPPSMTDWHTVRRYADVAEQDFKDTVETIRANHKPCSPSA